MKLIFIYNAKSGGLNSLFDYAHKIINPSTYNCNLCKLTHSNIGERKEWQKFKKSSNIEMEFFHIDEFKKKYKKKFEYPAILKKVNGNLSVLIDHKNINETENLTKLIQEIKKEL